MKDTGFIVILAYPDTVVRVANGEKISKLWPYFGVGGKNKVQAGHAALLLVEKESSTIEYYDFGRYITANSFGRVRGATTDYEVEIPFKAKHDGSEIKNLKEILLFLEKSPEKTHGEGRMVASVNHKIDYLKAKMFILNLQKENHVPYGAFVKNGSNCARFVTDTLIESTTDKAVAKKLKRSKYLTPSPISNIINGGISDASYFEVYEQKIVAYKNRSVSKEHRKCFFNKVSQEINEIGTVLPDVNRFYSENAQWLGGIGSGAWFEMELETSSNHYRILRRNVDGVIDMDAEFKVLQSGFRMHSSYEFLHKSNGSVCFVRQENKVFEFVFVNKN
jgi:hypothetical protein